MFLTQRGEKEEEEEEISNQIKTTYRFLRTISFRSSAVLTGTHQSMFILPIYIYPQQKQNQTQNLESRKENKRIQRETKNKPRSWNPAKGTIKRAGWSRSEMRETNRSLSSLGEGNVKSAAIAASAATTYVSIIHCNAIFLFFVARSLIFFLFPSRDRL